MTEAIYRRDSKGVNIDYSVANCALGLVLVAATDKGVCCIELGDSKRELEQALRKRFPQAEIAENEPALKRQLSEVVSLVGDPQRQCALDLDVQGTAFQMRVWDELRKVPVGATTTYTEIARRISKPGAVRAVANAVAGNKLAVVIPCHRVIRQSGELSGYYWGADRKRRLLESEGSRLSLSN